MWGLAYFVVAGAVAWFMALREWRSVRDVDALDDAAFGELRLRSVNSSGFLGLRSSDKSLRFATTVLKALIWISSVAVVALAVFAAVRGVAVRDFGALAVWALALTCLVVPFAVWAISVTERYERIDKRVARSGSAK